MNPTLLSIPTAIALASISVASHADLQIKFVESAPKDWFAFTNAGNCVLENTRLDIDLTNSAGKLIFDTTATGAGVEVFQPFEVRSGTVKLVSSNEVADGDRTLSVIVESLKPGETASFTIDVDDTLPNSELGMIRVSGSEINGSEVRISFDGMPAIEGKLNQSGELRLAHGDCV